MEEDKKKQWAKLIKGIVLLSVVFYIGYFNGSYNKNHITAQSTPVIANDAPMNPKHVPEGMYRVGRDIPAGEYKLINDDHERGAYFEITSDTSRTSESIINNDSFTNQSFITVKDGEYIKTERCYMEKLN